MRKNIFFVFALLILLPNILLSNVSMWENFTDMKNVVSISVDPGSSISYCASSGGLYVVDLNSGNVLKKYTNLNGLISNELTAITIDNQNRLWIGASDGSITIYDYRNSTWKYILDIKNSNESNKSINSFAIHNDSIFVATGYGIQNISTLNLNFIDAPYYQLGNLNNKTKVNDLTILNNVLYAATASGIAYASLINTNLNNPASWTTYKLAPMNEDVLTIDAFNNNVYAGSNSGFQYFDGSSWSPYPNSNVADTNVISIKSIADRLYFVAGRIIYYAVAGALQNIIQFQPAGNYNTISSDNNQNPIIGSVENGSLLKIGSNYEYVAPNGPHTSSFDYLAADDNGNIWAAGGQSNAGFYKFDGSTWENYNTGTHPEIGNCNNYRKIYYGNETLWALCYGGGITKIKGNTTKYINPSNSVLPGISGSPNYCVPFGGAYDSHGYFWTSFYATNTSRSLYVYTGNDSLWTGFINPSIIMSANLGNIAIDNYNTKWIESGEATPRGLYFFNENGTISNPSDDIYGFYNLNDFDVDDITDVIVDRNNEVWISTNNGVFYISNPLAAIQNPNQKPAPEKLMIISGNLAVPFTENCRTIRNDILNEKWIGTENNGVFHLSEDGSTLIEQFNTSNSPILDNSITSIIVSNKTGKAYFGTLNGLSSYQTNAIEPVEEFEDIICSPNPYLLPPNVDLRIDGLIEDSFIKIITLNGQVVTEFESPGGKIATWNGRDTKNNLVPTGIYIVVAFNKDGSKVGKGKVAIVRK